MLLWTIPSSSCYLETILLEAEDPFVPVLFGCRLGHSLLAREPEAVEQAELHGGEPGRGQAGAPDVAPAAKKMIP